MTTPGRARILAVLLIGLGALAAYADSYGGPFVFDDGPSILGNATIRSLWPLGPVLNPPTAGGVTVGGRPILNLSLALNYAISGTRVWSYHALNVLIHLLAGLVLFGIVRRTIERWGALSPTRFSADGAAQRVGDNALHPTGLALAVALLWTLHPLQTEAVTYTIQRAESLMGLFYLLTLYCFVRAVEMAGGGPAFAPRGGAMAGKKPPREAAFWFGLSWLACLFGMATKEVMVTAPVLVLLYDRTFVGGTFRNAWRQRGRVHLALAATWVLLAGLMIRTGSRGGTIGFGSGVPWWAYALTQFHAVALYLRLAAWPHPLVFAYAPAWVSGPGPVLAPALVVLALLAATAWACSRPAGGARATGFLGAWFFLILAPTSSVVPGSVQTIVEHRLYLPLAAVVVLVVLLLFGTVRRTIAWWSALAICLSLAAVLGVLTFRRNATYRSDVALWADTAARQPESAQAHCNLGAAWLVAGRPEAAIAEFQRAEALDPGLAEAYHDEGTALRQTGRIAAAIDRGETAVRLRPADAPSRQDLGLALAAAGRLPEAIAAEAAALRLAPGAAGARYDLGCVLLQAGREGEAAEQFAAVLRLDPDDAGAHLNLGVILRRRGHVSEAIVQDRAALRLQPGSVPAHLALGNALAQADDGPGALAEFAAALRLAPASVEAHFNRGNLLARAGRWAEAAAEYEEVLRLDPALAAARAHLEDVRARQAAGP